jgi:adenosylcobinamide hydrolase
VTSPADLDPVVLGDRVEHGRPWPVLTWRPPPGTRMISTAVLGGGLGPRDWWLNTQVPRDYRRTDPERHLAEIAAGLGLSGPGVGLLTAADVRHATAGADGGVRVVATVGLGLPVPAAASVERIAREGGPAPAAAFGPGTINVLVVLPVPLRDAALVNLVVTATEAKTQALVEAGVPGTGTSSDAVCVACPDGPGGEPFGGPRSVWGARAARAVHRAVSAGTADWQARDRRIPDIVSDRDR